MNAAASALAGNMLGPGESVPHVAIPTAAYDALAELLRDTAPEKEKTDD